MRIIQKGRLPMAFLRKRKIAVLGYGSQGRAQALNLRDSGCRVVVGLRPHSPSFQMARRDAMTAKPIPQALMGADLICFLFPDEFQREIYLKYVAPQLRKGISLMFAHGFNITFKKICPPEFVNVFMISPKGPGPWLRKAYLENDGVPALLAIHQDVTGQTQKLALAYAKAIGCVKRGLFETTFREETLSDLFGEQTVLCGGVIELMKAAFDTLVRGGISPRAAYFECFHELKFIVDLLHHQGISGMAESVSSTAHYGGMTRGGRLVNASVRQELQKIFKEIQSGKFAEEWLLENRRGRKRYKSLARQMARHPIEHWGRKIRKEIGYSRSS